MSEAVLILPNMRGGCATVGGTVHAMFRVNGRRHEPMARPQSAAPVEAGRSIESAAMQNGLSLTTGGIAC